MFKVLAKTINTDWVLVGEFETREQARNKVSEILNNDSSVTCTIEEDDAQKKE